MLSQPWNTTTKKQEEQEEEMRSLWKFSSSEKKKATHENENGSWELLKEKFLW